ncbi:fimbria/pilus outer membrane usher protein [Pseudomonas sp. RW10S2]|uniref:fimbria/pilus outer membrane usher protein n=1 Tax=Pseudomonas sp. RW10S2 TaxID=459637 RepID=UPI00192DB8C9
MPRRLLVLSLFASTNALGNPSDNLQVASVQFNEQFLRQSGRAAVDISRFEKDNVALPGGYRADLIVNGNWVGRAQITLRQIPGGTHDVQPCFDRDLLQQVGADLMKLSPDAAERLTAETQACLPIATLIPEAFARFDNGEQKLDISIPQASMSREARGYVHPRYWDEGIPAALLSYNGNAYRTNYEGGATTQAHLGLNTGLNLGSWRLRHNGNYTYNTQNGRDYQSVQTNLQRSIAPWQARLVLGDGFTDGLMFDSVGFRGLQIASDERMSPQSQRGYAPTIRGIANSNALVQVSQNGNLIYSTNVATGPFEIDDLYPTGYGGDLDVKVTEADGREHSFKVPYAAAVDSLRPGVTRFGLTAGQYRSPLLSSEPTLLQGTARHGFSNLLTGYAGVTSASGYQSGVIGTALNTRLGAFALDLSAARAELANLGTRNGQSAKLSYSKLINPTHTNITVAAYRYSSRGYLGLSEAMLLRDTQEGGINGLLGSSIRRGQFQVTLNQGLAQGWGSLYLSGSTVNYWNRSDNDTQFQVGYNNHFKRLNYGVSASRQYDVTQKRWDSRYMLNLSIPLSFGSRTLYASSGLQRDSRGSTQLQQSISGTKGVDNALAYSLSAGRSSGNDMDTTQSLGGNLSYKSPYATITTNASKNTSSTQYGGGISGGVVVYADGVAFTPTMGETVAIVEAENASGARVTSGSGLRIDPFGRALVSGLTPFSTNQVEIDPKGLPMSVELDSSIQHVAPTAGAVVRLRFETSGGGRSVIMRASQASGHPLPFGAEVKDAAGQHVGTVAQGGRIVLRGLQTVKGTLHATWGDSATEGCSLPYELPTVDETSELRWTTTEAVCTQK